ncbi:hypothetical protein D3C80_1191750 [compost metagenome]
MFETLRGTRKQLDLDREGLNCRILEAVEHWAVPICLFDLVPASLHEIPEARHELRIQGLNDQDDIEIFGSSEVAACVIHRERRCDAPDQDVSVLVLAEMLGKQF